MKTIKIIFYATSAIGTTFLTVHAGFTLGQYALDWSKLDQSINEKRLSISHTLPSRGNAIALRQHVVRCVVHLRDPRQSILSRIHKIERKLKDKDYGWYERITPALPEGYACMKLEDKLWWQLTNELQPRIDMIQGWIDYQALSNNPVQILFTTHQELKEFPELLFAVIMDFFNLPSSNLNLNIKKGDHKKYNYRKGSHNEWQQIYSYEQKQYAEAFFTTDIKTRFGW